MAACRLQAKWFYYAIENLPDNIGWFKSVQSGLWNQRDLWWRLNGNSFTGLDYVLYQEYAHLINTRVWDSYFIDRSAAPAPLPSGSQTTGRRLQQRCICRHLCISVFVFVFDMLQVAFCHITLVLMLLRKLMHLRGRLLAGCN